MRSMVYTPLSIDYKGFYNKFYHLNKKCNFAYMYVSCNLLARLMVMIFISLLFLLLPISCQYFVGRKLLGTPKIVFFTFTLIMILIQAYLVAYVPRISGYRFEEFINCIEVTELRSNP